jgi:hypothetical protein
VRKGEMLGRQGEMIGKQRGSVRKKGRGWDMWREGLQAWLGGM